MLPYVFRMERYDNLHKPLIIPELKESVEIETPVCVIYSTNAFSHLVYKFP